MRTLRLTLLLCATALALASSAHATVTVFMRDGSVVRGTLVDVEVQFVTLLTPSGNRSIDLGAVKRIVSADGTVAYEGVSNQATPAATPEPVPSPVPTAAPARPPQAGPAPTAVPPAGAPGSPPARPAPAPTPSALDQAQSPAYAPAPHRRLGLALSWAGGLLAAAGAGLTFAAANQADLGARDRLGTGAAFSAGVGLISIVVGALLRPHPGPDDPAAALPTDAGRQLCWGLPARDQARSGGPQARLLSATF